MLSFLVLIFIMWEFPSEWYSLIVVLLSGSYCQSHWPNKNDGWCLWCFLWFLLYAEVEGTMLFLVFNNICMLAPKYLFCCVHILELSFICYASRILYKPVWTYWLFYQIPRYDELHFLCQKDFLDMNSVCVNEIIVQCVQAMWTYIYLCKWRKCYTQ